MNDNWHRAKKSQQEVESVTASINNMGSAVQGFSGFAEAFGTINQRVSENRTDLSSIDESISALIEFYNIPSGGRS
jgi:hypothetical protein